MSLYKHKKKVIVFKKHIYIRLTLLCCFLSITWMHKAQMKYLKVQLVTTKYYQNANHTFLLPIDTNLNVLLCNYSQSKQTEFLERINDHENRIYYDKDISYFYDTLTVNKLTQILWKKVEFSQYKVDFYICSGYLSYELRKYNQFHYIPFFLQDFSYKQRRLHRHFLMNFVHGIISWE